MQKSYWTHQRSSRGVMLLTLVLALGGVAAVELVDAGSSDELNRQKAAAAELSHVAMQAIREERLARGIPIDPEADPTGSGLIGVASSNVTSVAGHLPAKQTSINPNFAAAIVQMFHEAGVKKGDVVAVGMSGSFPAMNLHLCAAMETMGVKPIIIASAAGSQWGANHPEFLWLDMEQALYERNLISFRSVAASLGGLDDGAAGMNREGIELLKQGIARAGVPLLEVNGYFDSLEKRLALYQEKAGDRPIAAYVNVGGGTVSVGTNATKNMFQPGLNTRAPVKMPVESIMGHYLKSGVPVIHLSNIETLALRYQLPIAPTVAQAPAGAAVQAPHSYDRRLAGTALALVLGVLYLPMVARRLRRWHADRQPKPREPEVVKHHREPVMSA